jgi:hypothetical protein
MKRIFRSLLMICLILVTTVTASLGYFVKQVTATDNAVQTGTLRLAIDSTQSGAGNEGYEVARDDGTAQQVAQLPTISNLEPGASQSIFVAIRNTGSLPFAYRARISGSWGNATLDNVEPSNQLFTVSVGQMDSSTCYNDAECNDLMGWLNNQGYSFVGAGMPLIGDVNVHDTAFFGASSPADPQFILQSGAANGSGNTGEYAILKLDFVLDPSAGNEFEGQTFTWAFDTQSTQTTAPSF